jgi:hypothetical protein
MSLPWFSFAAFLSVSCGDIGTEAGRAPKASNVGSSSPVLTQREVGPRAAALHRKNRFDWAGAAHNRAQEAIMAEVSRRGAGQMCAILLDYAANSPDFHGPMLDNSADARTRERAKIRNGPLCNPRARTNNVVNPAAPRLEETCSTACSDMMVAIVAAYDQTTGAEDLADRLSPIYDDAESLGTEERDAVQGTIAIVQWSYDLWSPPAAQAGVEWEVQDLSERCHRGDAENESYMNLDGITYTCVGSNWYGTTFEGTLRKPNFIASRTSVLDLVPVNFVSPAKPVVRRLPPQRARFVRHSTTMGPTTPPLCIVPDDFISSAIGADAAGVYLGLLAAAVVAYYTDISRPQRRAVAAATVIGGGVGVSGAMAIGLAVACMVM